MNILKTLMFIILLMNSYSCKKEEILKEKTGKIVFRSNARNIDSPHLKIKILIDDEYVGDLLSDENEFVVEKTPGQYCYLGALYAGREYSIWSDKIDIVADSTIYVFFDIFKTNSTKDSSFIANQ